MIKFIISCSNFQDAAQVEKLLNQKELRYSLEMEGRHGTALNGTPKSKRKRPRTTITPAIIKSVDRWEPKTPAEIVAKAVGISKASVHRIRAGHYDKES